MRLCDLCNYQFPMARAFLYERLPSCQWKTRMSLDEVVVIDTLMNTVSHGGC